MGSERIEGELFQLLAEFALAIGQLDQAFAFFCKAQREGHGWSPFWGFGQQTSRRAAVIKQNFPGRWREFIKESLKSQQFGFPPNRIGNLDFRIGSEFLIEIGQLNEAEMLTEAAVQFAEELMADLSLPPCNWIGPDINADVWPVLFSRLTSPIPIVRERAASELSELLTEKITSDATLAQLTKWLASQRLESMIPLGLLALVKASRRQPILTVLGLEKISDAIKVPSVISDQLWDDIRRHLR